MVKLPGLGPLSTGILILVVEILVFGLWMHNAEALSDTFVSTTATFCVALATENIKPRDRRQHLEFAAFCLVLNFLLFFGVLIAIAMADETNHFLWLFAQYVLAAAVVAVTAGSKSYLDRERSK